MYFKNNWIPFKIFFTIFISLFLEQINAQKIQPDIDTFLPIPKLSFKSNGELFLKASKQSSQFDFDFLVGSWKLYNRKLKSRLTNCSEWLEFESSVQMHQILGGMGNIDTYKAIFDDMPYEGVAMRLFDRKTKLWSIYWADQNSGVLDPPLIGSFENNIGHFFCRDVFQNKPIIVLFRWDVRDKNKPVWSQAFSPDDGKSWEWNFVNVSIRNQ